MGGDGRPVGLAGAADAGHVPVARDGGFADAAAEEAVAATDDEFLLRRGRWGGHVSGEVGGLGGLAVGTVGMKKRFEMGQIVEKRW